MTSSKFVWLKTCETTDNSVTDLRWKWPQIICSNPILQIFIYVLQYFHKFAQLFQDCI